MTKVGKPDREGTFGRTRVNDDDAPLADRSAYPYPRKHSAAFQRGGAVSGRL